MITVKIRITADSESDAELIRIHLERKLGDGLKLAKARQGSNPKYADDQKWMSYGMLTLTKKPRQPRQPKVNEQLTIKIKPPKGKK